MSNYAPYRWCVVSECENTSVKTPDKLWIQVPVDINMRNTWLKVVSYRNDVISMAATFRSVQRQIKKPKNFKLQ